MFSMEENSSVVMNAVINMMQKINNIVTSNWLFKHSKVIQEIHRRLWWEYHDYKNIVNYGIADFPNDFNIETTTYCNRRCSFCPNSKHSRGLKENEVRMETNTFHKIIEELASYNFQGRIGLHFYGEPLLDDRLEAWVEHIKVCCPKCHININTNGDYLTPELYVKLSRAGVDKFFVGMYDGHPSKPMIKVLNFLEKNPSEKRASIKYEQFNIEAPRATRGGEVQIKNVEPPRCLSPTSPMVIDALGNVALCCNDYHTSVCFGNIKYRTIMDIWNGKEFKEVREKLRRRIYELPICKICSGEVMS